MDEARIGNGDGLLKAAQEAALAAGDLLLQGWKNTPRKVAAKSSPTDLVSELDTASEALIVQMLLSARPHDAVLGEEGGERSGTSGVRWIIDPLDGTANYLHGLPAFAVSVAAECDGEAIVGVVHDPSRQETFCAVRGRGAWLNGNPITVSQETKLSQALLGTGFSHSPSGRARQAALLTSLVSRVHDLRHSGSAALDLCWVAAGRLDVYYECDTRHWDRAAGALIAAEAGATVSGIDDGPPTDELVIAGPQALVNGLRALISDLLGARPGR